MRYLALVLIVIFCSCNSYIYVVRHAEKATPMGNNSDVPLTATGEQRALALEASLQNKKIGAVYSTNTIRTKSTAKPTADHFLLPVLLYVNPPDSIFIASLKRSIKNTLVVGHSNTVDDIVNMLCGKKLIETDLKDTEYDNLFVVKRSGKKFTLIRKHYGISTVTPKL
jgi:2,3-bisphosphoglycerate-dependent phosphoglycerate mutase